MDVYKVGLPPTLVGQRPGHGAQTVVGFVGRVNGLGVVVLTLLNVHTLGYFMVVVIGVCTSGQRGKGFDAMASTTVCRVLPGCGAICVTVVVPRGQLSFGVLSRRVGTRVFGNFGVVFRDNI